MTLRAVSDRSNVASPPLQQDNILPGSLCQGMLARLYLLVITPPTGVTVHFYLVKWQLSMGNEKELYFSESASDSINSADRPNATRQWCIRILFGSLVSLKKGDRALRSVEIKVLFKDCKMHAIRFQTM